MMWWMNHAYVVLQYERNLSTKKRNEYRSGADRTPEAPNLEKRPFFKMRVARDKALEEAWHEKQISNHEIHSALIEFKNDHQQEEEINKKLFRRLDAKLNSIFNKLDNNVGSIVRRDWNVAGETSHWKKPRVHFMHLDHPDHPDHPDHSDHPDHPDESSPVEASAGLTEARSPCTVSNSPVISVVAPSPTQARPAQAGPTHTSRLRRLPPILPGSCEG
jgi:hypothetical protein